jgi:hypothetical protein
MSVCFPHNKLLIQDWKNLKKRNTLENYRKLSQSFKSSGITSYLKSSVHFGSWKYSEGEREKIKEGRK